MQHNDVASTSFRRHVPTRFLINQCQIITFLILKSDIIENSSIEFRGIVLPVPSNQIKITLILLLFYPSTWYICNFSLFHIEIKGKDGWIIWGGGGGGGGGGGQRVCCPPPPPSQIIGGPGPPLPTPYDPNQAVLEKILKYFLFLNPRSQPAVPFCTLGQHLNTFGRGLLGNATYQISRP